MCTDSAFNPYNQAKHCNPAAWPVICSPTAQSSVTWLLAHVDHRGNPGQQSSTTNLHTCKRAPAMTMQKFFHNGVHKQKSKAAPGMAGMGVPAISEQASACPNLHSACLDFCLTQPNSVPSLTCLTAKEACMNIPPIPRPQQHALHTTHDSILICSSSRCHGIATSAFVSSWLFNSISWSPAQNRVCRRAAGRQAASTRHKQSSGILPRTSTKKPAAVVQCADLPVVHSGRSFRPGCGLWARSYVAGPSS